MSALLKRHPLKGSEARQSDISDEINNQEEMCVSDLKICEEKNNNSEQITKSKIEKSGNQAKSQQQTAEELIQQIMYLSGLQFNIDKVGEIEVVTDQLFGHFQITTDIDAKQKILYALFQSFIKRPKYQALYKANQQLDQQVFDNISLIQQLQQQNEELQRQLQKSNQDNEDLQKQNDDLLQKMHLFKAQNDVMNYQEATFDKQRQYLLNIVDYTKKQYDLTKQRLHSKQHQLLKDQKASESIQINALMREIDQLEEEIQNIHQSKKGIERENSNLQSRINQLNMLLIESKKVPNNILLSRILFNLTEESRTITQTDRDLIKLIQNLSRIECADSVVTWFNQTKQQDDYLWVQKNIQAGDGLWKYGSDGVYNSEFDVDQVVARKKQQLVIVREEKANNEMECEDYMNEDPKSIAVQAVTLQCNSQQQTNPQNIQIEYVKVVKNQNAFIMDINAQSSAVNMDCNIQNKHSNQQCQENKLNRSIDKFVIIGKLYQQAPSKVGVKKQKFFTNTQKTCQDTEQEQQINKQTEKQITKKYLKVGNKQKLIENQQANDDNNIVLPDTQLNNNENTVNTNDQSQNKNIENKQVQQLDNDEKHQDQIKENCNNQQSAGEDNQQNQENNNNNINIASGNKLEESVNNLNVTRQQNIDNIKQASGIKLNNSVTNLQSDNVLQTVNSISVLNTQQHRSTSTINLNYISDQLKKKDIAEEFDCNDNTLQRADVQDKAIQVSNLFNANQQYIEKFLSKLLAESTYDKVKEQKIKNLLGVNDESTENPNLANIIEKYRQEHQYEQIKTQMAQQADEQQITQPTSQKQQNPTFQLGLQQTSSQVRPIAQSPMRKIVKPSKHQQIQQLDLSVQPKTLTSQDVSNNNIKDLIQQKLRTSKQYQQETERQMKQDGLKIRKYPRNGITLSTYQLFESVDNCMFYVENDFDAISLFFFDYLTEQIRIPIINSEGVIFNNNNLELVLTNEQIKQIYSQVLGFCNKDKINQQQILETLLYNHNTYVDGVSKQTDQDTNNETAIKKAQISISNNLKQMLPQHNQKIKYICCSSLSLQNQCQIYLDSPLTQQQIGKVQYEIINETNYISVQHQNVILKELTWIQRLTRHILQSYFQYQQSYMKLQQYQLQEYPRQLNYLEAENLFYYVLHYIRINYSTSIGAGQFFFTFIGNLAFYQYFDHHLYLFTRLLFDLDQNYFLNYIDAVGFLNSNKLHVKENIDQLTKYIFSNYSNNMLESILSDLNQIKEQQLILPKLLNMITIQRKQTYQSCQLIIHHLMNQAKITYLNFSILQQLNIILKLRMTQDQMLQFFIFLSQFQKCDQNSNNDKTVSISNENILSIRNADILSMDLCRQINQIQLTLDMFDNFFSSYQLNRFVVIPKDIVEEASSIQLKQLIKQSFIVYQNLTKVVLKITRYFEQLVAINNKESSRLIHYIKSIKLCHKLMQESINVYDYETSVTYMKNLLTYILEGSLLVIPEYCVVVINGAVSAMRICLGIIDDVD